MEHLTRGPLTTTELAGMVAADIPHGAYVVAVGHRLVFGVPLVLPSVVTVWVAAPELLITVAAQTPATPASAATIQAKRVPVSPSVMSPGQS
jgi:hypothetical protein